MQKYTLILCGLFWFLDMGPIKNNLADTYINQYKQISMLEMQRTGIPASIKLAQGLLESNWGRSELSRQANNHFGIKCGGAWTGGTFYKVDDDFDKNGALIKSCFRAYDKAQLSYMAHSDFLAKPRRSKRYDFLFDYDPRDYKSWAKGLQKAGYATDPKYPNKLIKIIEKYKLYQYDDLALDPNLSIKSEIASAPKPEADTDDKEVRTTVTTPVPENTDVATTNKDQESIPKATALAKTTDRISIHNGIPAINSLKGETPISISRKFDLALYRLQTYNDGLGKSNEVLKEGTLVFLDEKQEQLKHKNAPSNHTVAAGETMRSIAREYGVKLKSLYKRNRIPKGAEPLVGEEIKLNGMVKITSRPAFKTAAEIAAGEEEYLFDENFAGTRE